MKRRAATLALTMAAAGALAACAGPTAERRGVRLAANPGAVVATELAFARAAQETGQWAAFRRFAADDAVMFTPQPTRAKDWLRGRAEPAVALTWQPYEVWSSCDGTLAVTRGAWQGPKGTGYFITVWRRQANGDYRWELDQGDDLAQPLPAPEMISGQVAECSPAPGPAGAAAAAGASAGDARSGASRDLTLVYSTDVRSDGSRTFEVRRWTGSGYEVALRSQASG